TREVTGGGAGGQQRLAVAQVVAAGGEHAVRVGQQLGDQRGGEQRRTGLLRGAEVLAVGIRALTRPEVLGQGGAVDGLVRVGREDRDGGVGRGLADRSRGGIGRHPTTDDHVVVPGFQIRHRRLLADRVVPPRYSCPPTPATVPIPGGAGPCPRADRPILHTPLRHPRRRAVPFPRYRPRVVDIGGTKRRVVLTHGAPGPRAEPGPSLRRGPPGVPAIGPCSRSRTGRAWMSPP